MKDLVFDPVEHKYFYKGKPVPGVNECLRDAKITKPYDGDEWYTTRGKTVHLAIQYYLKGTLDETTIDDQIRPQFEAFRKFWDSLSADERIVDFIEEPFTDGVFAGTIDAITRSTVFDWKTVKKHKKEDELKGQGYKKLLAMCGLNRRNFVIVELHDDGTYEAIDYGCEFDTWDSVLKLREWHNTPNSKRAKKCGMKQP